MAIHQTWLRRNLLLRQLGLPVLDDRQHRALFQDLSEMASILDEALSLAGQRLLNDEATFASVAQTSGCIRPLAAALAELRWRVPPACNDLAAEQGELLDQLKLLDRTTLSLAKALP